jgi:hypothetical protein
MKEPGKVSESGVERGNGGGSSSTLCGTTHESSARQRPTNEDHEGGFGRSSNISLIKPSMKPTSTLVPSTSPAARATNQFPEVT